jgi:hypothetical protein
MKQYLLSIYQPDGTPPPPEALSEIRGKLDVINDELKASGSWVFAGGLHPPSTATVLRVQGGNVLTTDGPFTEEPSRVDHHDRAQPRDRPLPPGGHPRGAPS